MAVVTTNLTELIRDILRNASKALTTPEIENQLAGNGQFDTFDVRDAVRQLVRSGEAKYEQPGYRLTLASPRR